MKEKTLRNRIRKVLVKLGIEDVVTLNEVVNLCTRYANTQLKDFQLQIRQDERKKTLEEVEIVLTDDRSLYDEWWCAWYDCPKCGESNITEYFKYCPDCGVKLKLLKEGNEKERN